MRGRACSVPWKYCIWTLQPTLSTRAGFFLESDEELRRTQVVDKSGEGLTETGNHAWKASGTQGNFSAVTRMGMKAGWTLAVWMPLSCIAFCIFHIISIPFNCSDTTIRVTEAMIGVKGVCFVSRIWRQDSSPGSLAFPHLGNRDEISHMNPRQNSSR